MGDHVRPRLSTLRLSPAREHEIVEELSQHLEDRWRELVAGGASEDEATRLALAEFREGNLLARYMAPLRQALTLAPITPGAPTGHVLRDVSQDLRYASASLRRQPAFSLAAVLTLALGIGATTAIFSVVNAVVIKPLPYPDADAIVTVTHSAVTGDVRRASNFPFLPHRCWRSTRRTARPSRNWECIGLARLQSPGWRIPSRPTRCSMTAGALRALNVPPALGRSLSRDDDQPGAAETAMLSDGYWQRRFGGDPSVIGRTITVDGRPREVIGVMPARFTLRELPWM